MAFKNIENYQLSEDNKYVEDGGTLRFSHSVVLHRAAYCVQVALLTQESEHQ